MGTTVEQCREILRADLEDYVHVLPDPIGNSGTYRKIQRYLFVCITEGKDRVECKDWLYKLYENQTDEESNRFKSKVDLLANALYDFFNYLQQKRG